MYYFNDGYRKEEMQRGKIVFEGAELVYPEKGVRRTDLFISGTRIRTALPDTGEQSSSVSVIPCSGYRIYPALINAHDHPFYNWYPRVTRREYGDYIQWMKARWKEADPSEKESSEINLKDRLALTFYKQVLSGVGTVEVFIENRKKLYLYGYPVRMLDMFSHSHSVFVDKQFLASDFDRTKGLQPYFIHVGEGKTARMARELNALDQAGVLRSNTVLVHALGFTTDGWKLAAQRGASLVWCPSSNLHLYGSTPRIPMVLDLGVTVALATDGALTGGTSLFEEMRMAAKTFPELEPERIFRMVTIDAATVLRMGGVIGGLNPNCPADVLLLKKKTCDPYLDLMNTSPQDIALLMVDGRALFGDPEFCLRLPGGDRLNTVRISGQEKRIIGDPEALLGRIEHQLGHHKAFPFLPLDSPPTNISPAGETGGSGSQGATPSQ